jgi:hypothetical protein
MPLLSHSGPTSFIRPAHVFLLKMPLAIVLNPASATDSPAAVVPCMTIVEMRKPRPTIVTRVRISWAMRSHICSSEGLTAASLASDSSHPLNWS